MTPIPPHDLGLEAAVISAAWLDPDALSIATAEVRPEDFYSPAHRVCWEATMDLAKAGEPVDAVTVAGKLIGKGRLDEIGGRGFLAALTDATPALAHVGAHVATMRRLARRRAMIATCQRVAAQGYYDDSDAYLAESEAAVFAIASQAGPGKQDRLARVGDVVHTRAVEIGQAIEAGEVGRIPTPWGIAALDGLTHGVHPGHLVVLGARPGMGKSAFMGGAALSVARHMDRDVGCASLVFSAEMPNSEFAERILASEAKIDSTKLRAGTINLDDMSRIAPAVDALKWVPCWVDDTPEPTVMHVRAGIRRVKSELARWQGQNELRLVFVDHAQIMGSDGGKQGESRDRELGRITGALKRVAKEENLCIVLLSQLNRGVETRGGSKRPTLGDLRDTGNLEQDADFVIFLYRDEYYTKGQTRFPNIGEAIVAKQRGGRLGRALMRFEKEWTMFRDLTPSERAQLDREEEEEAYAPAPKQVGGGRYGKGFSR